MVQHGDELLELYRAVPVLVNVAKYFLSQSEILPTAHLNFIIIRYKTNSPQELTKLSYINLAILVFVKTFKLFSANIIMQPNSTTCRRPGQ